MKNWVYPPYLEGLRNFQDGLTHFLPRVYPISVSGCFVRATAYRSTLPLFIEGGIPRRDHAATLMVPCPRMTRIYFCQHDGTDDTDCHASLSLACSHPAGKHKRSACAISEISAIALTKASCHPERRERSRPSVLEISRRFQAAEAALLGEPEGSFVATDAHFASAK